MPGIITGMLLSRDNNHFEVVQMMIAIGLFTLLAAALAFAPLIRKSRKKNNEHTKYACAKNNKPENGK